MLDGGSTVGTAGRGATGVGVDADGQPVGLVNDGRARVAAGGIDTVAEPRAAGQGAERTGVGLLNLDQVGELGLLTLP